MPELMGNRVREVITGFEGVATGRASYLTGCEQYLVQPTTRKPDGDLHDAKWWDVDRLELIGPKVRLPEHTSNGCDLPAPVK